MLFKHLLVLICVAATISVASQQQAAYGHGCQAQGGSCTVGGACVDLTANSPIWVMFVAIGIAGALLFKFYGTSAEQRVRLGAIFNIFR